MAGGYLTITFLPILSRHIAAGDEEGEWRSFVAVFRPVALVMIGLTALGDDLGAATGGVPLPQL